jgi:hypothetical protein
MAELNIVRVSSTLVEQPPLSLCRYHCDPDLSQSVRSGIGESNQNCTLYAIDSKSTVDLKRSLTILEHLVMVSG